MSFRSRDASIACAIVLFTGGVLIGQYVPSFLPGADTTDSQNDEIFQRGSSYKFVSPLLFCGDDTLNNDTQKLSNQIEARVNAEIAAAKENAVLTDASVYYRGLDGGTWSLVNKDFRAQPASLLKLPIAIDIYKHAESDPKFLTQEVFFRAAQDTSQVQHFPPPERLTASTTYSVAELTRRMLQNSDNESLILLGDQLSDQELKQTYDDLGISPPTTAQKDYAIGTRTFGSFFRILYNASYLNAADSETLLREMASSTFSQGVVSGVPSGTMVSHKFGETTGSDGSKQLNDCGIVYPKDGHAYLLCIMTSGKDFDALATFIATISHDVWQIAGTH